MIANLKKKWETSVSTQIAHYKHIKGSSERPESFTNCIVRFTILVLTAQFCFSKPNSCKDGRVKSFIFLLISTLILKACWGYSIGQEQNFGNARVSDVSFQFQDLKNK